MNNSRDLILAIVLSLLVLAGWNYFVQEPKIEAEKARQQEVQKQNDTAGVPGNSEKAENGNAPKPSKDDLGQAPQAPEKAKPLQSRASVIERTARLPIETDKLKGSINLTGARLDDLKLRNYKETLEKDSGIVTLFSPDGAPSAYFAELGWSTSDNTVKVPGNRTIWTAPEGAKLSIDSPVTLTYNNGEGIIFRRTITIDKNYMFSITQEVENNSGKNITLYPYGLVTRKGLPDDLQNFFILHEGLFGHFSDDGLQEIDYSDVDTDKDRVKKFSSQGGWIGITDKYWAAVLIPNQAEKATFRFSNIGKTEHDEKFQTDYLGGPKTIAPGSKTQVSNRIFAGAKQVDIVDNYADTLKIENFDLLIDWGWFYFFTKPLFIALHYLFKFIGNFGVAIIALTFLLKLLLFPLANKSYKSISRMKKLAPEMNEIKERYEDKKEAQQAILELYRKHKVNPASGCLPILAQIPIFFALYKVLFVTIEMRHAPFFGWIQDLAAPDPTSIFNLFGLLPFEPPQLLMIGVWPILMGISMWVQQKMNPPPTDEIQAKIFAWFPFVFTFLLAGFPAGLVIYWAVNNTLSVLQQSVIMKRMGVKIELFDNIKLKKSKK